MVAGAVAVGLIYRYDNNFIVFLQVTVIYLYSLRAVGSAYVEHNVYVCIFLLFLAVLALNRPNKLLLVPGILINHSIGCYH